MGEGKGEEGKDYAVLEQVLKVMNISDTMADTKLPESGLKELLFPLEMSYDFPPEELSQPKPLDYGTLPYFDTAPESVVESKEEYFSTTVPEKDTGAESMKEEEARSALEEMQLAAVMGDSSSVSPEERRRFCTWALFSTNTPLLRLYESLHGMTRDVDYARVG